MEAQILLCDHIDMNMEHKYHTLGKVLNAIEVETLPAIYKAAVFVKLFNIPIDDEIAGRIIVYDSEMEYSCYTGMISLRNYRGEDQVPGVDFNQDIRMVISVPGIYSVEFYVNDSKVASYPLTVRVNQKETSEAG